MEYIPHAHDEYPDFTIIETLLELAGSTFMFMKNMKITTALINATISAIRSAYLETECICILFHSSDFLD